MQSSSACLSLRAAEAILGWAEKSPKPALGPSTPQGLGDERQGPRPLTALRPPAELPRVSEPNHRALGLQERQGGEPSLRAWGLHTPSVCATLPVKTAVAPIRTPHQPHSPSSCTRSPPQMGHLNLPLTSPILAPPWSSVRRAGTAELGELPRLPTARLVPGHGWCLAHRWPAWCVCGYTSQESHVPMFRGQGAGFCTWTQCPAVQTQSRDEARLWCGLSFRLTVGPALPATAWGPMSHSHQWA